MVGVGALILQDGELLLIRRRTQPGQGKWGVPGGLVELGENVQDAMMRETKEEVGLDVEAVKLMDVFDSVTLDEQGRIQYHFVVVNFLAHIVGGNLRTASDILEARWVSVGEVEKFNLTKSLRAIFEKHRDRIRELAFLSKE